MLRDIADSDAAHATVSIATTLQTTAARRAIAHAPDTRFDADPLRVHVTRHWYLHSYLDHLHTATRSQQPHPFNDQVERQVALTLTTHIVHPLIRDAAKTLTTPRRQQDRKVTDTDSADDPRLPIKEASPEEAARLMFHHGAQLHSPVARGTEKTSTRTNRLLGATGLMTASESSGRRLPPRTA